MKTLKWIFNLPTRTGAADAFLGYTRILLLLVLVGIAIVALGPLPIMLWWHVDPAAALHFLRVLPARLDRGEDWLLSAHGQLDALAVLFAGAAVAVVWRAARGRGRVAEAFRAVIQGAQQHFDRVDRVNKGDDA